MDLIAWLIQRGHRVSLGHSGATYEQGLDAIAAGARHATHLFNCMPALHHRTPTLAAAILDSEEVAAELICDGFHVHPTAVRMAIAAKGHNRIVAITDGTAASGLPAGAQARLGWTGHHGRRGRRLPRGRHAGRQRDDDGRAFRRLLGQGFTPVEASRMCSGTQAAELGLAGQGVIAPGALADLVVLDRRLEVVTTFVGGMPAWARARAAV